MAFAIDFSLHEALEMGRYALLSPRTSQNTDIGPIWCGGRKPRHPDAAVSCKYAALLGMRGGS